MVRLAELAGVRFLQRKQVGELQLHHQMVGALGLRIDSEGAIEADDIRLLRRLLEYVIGAERGLVRRTVLIVRQREDVLVRPLEVAARARLKRSPHALDTIGRRHVEQAGGDGRDG